MADFISREAAIERFCNVYCGCSPEECGFKIPQDGAEECAAVRALKETPAADVRPVVQGAWERPKGSTPRSWIFVCSKCGDRAYFPVPKYFPKGCGYSFCPNCGADMREVKDDG